MKRIILSLINFYRKCISPLTPPKCKYYPTCSCYAYKAVERYGIRLPQLSMEQWEEKLNDFLSTDFGLNSGIVGNCAEYNSIDRKEVDSELLYEYIGETGYLISDEFLDSDFLGENVLTIEDDEGSNWRDLREISEQTFDMGIIGQLVYALFPLSVPAPYLIDWVI